MFASLACFAIAAVGAATLAFLYFIRGKAPVCLALLHVLLVVSGVILLVLGMGQGHSGWIIVAALALFLIDALGGLIMLAARILMGAVSDSLDTWDGISVTFSTKAERGKVCE